MKNLLTVLFLVLAIQYCQAQNKSFPDFVNVSPKNHLQIMGRYVDVVS